MNIIIILSLINHIFPLKIICKNHILSNQNHKYRICEVLFIKLKLSWTKKIIELRIKVLKYLFYFYFYILNILLQFIIIETYKNTQFQKSHKKNLLINEFCWHLWHLRLWYLSEMNQLEYWSLKLKNLVYMKITLF
jgi:hypothetical protein